MEPLFQLGKGGMSDALIKQVDDALTARELIKVKVLRDTSPLTPREAADRIIFMDNGVIEEEGTPEEVFDNPKSERTREFIAGYSD